MAYSSNRFCAFALILALLAGCAKTYVSVRQMTVDRSVLASSFVGSPDPLQEDPPRGQMLIVDWRVEDWILMENPKVVLEVVLKNYETRRKEVEIYGSSGYFTYPVLSEEFDRTRGILTYKASLIGESGEVFRSWKQQLWVDLVDFGQDSTL